MQQAMKNRISLYEYTANFTPFNQYVAGALKRVLGGSQFYNIEALSISGYNLDFEILFDANCQPIPIPSHWNRRTQDILLNSVGFGRAKQRKRSSVEPLKEVEKVSDVFGISTSYAMTDVDTACAGGETY